MIGLNTAPGQCGCLFILICLQVDHDASRPSRCPANAFTKRSWECISAASMSLQDGNNKWARSRLIFGPAPEVRRATSTALSASAQECLCLNLEVSHGPSGAEI